MDSGPSTLDSGPSVANSWPSVVLQDEEMNEAEVPGSATTGNFQTELNFGPGTGRGKENYIVQPNDVDDDFYPPTRSVR